MIIDIEYLHKGNYTINVPAFNYLITTHSSVKATIENIFKEAPLEDLPYMENVITYFPHTVHFFIDSQTIYSFPLRKLIFNSVYY